MSIARFFTTSFTIATPTATAGDLTADSEGVPVVAHTASATVLGHVQPVSEAERVEGQQEAEARRTIWLPLGTSITHKSTVTYSGNRYEVIGDPRRWSVGSINDHLEVTISRTAR